MINKSRNTKHFFGVAPLFSEQSTENKRYYKNTVYYYMFEYLKRSKKYRDYCDYGIDDANNRMKQLFSEFGNIYKIEFIDWWKQFGINLFSDKEIDHRLSVISRIDECIIDDNVLYIKIPLYLNIDYVIKRMRTILKKHRGGEKGKKNAIQTARYKVIDGFILKSHKWNLLFYDFDLSLSSSQEKLKRYYYCERLGYFGNDKRSQVKDWCFVDVSDTNDHLKKAKCTQRANLYINNAKKMIKCMEDGYFRNQLINSKG